MTRKENNLFIITASNPEAFGHYIDTIENGFKLEKIEGLLAPKDKKILKNMYADKPIYAWGALNGSSNKRTWEKLNVGDPVLIYRVGNFEYYAFVTHKIHSKTLAEKLWNTNENGETWEYVYFLEQPIELSVPIRAFNTILGYQEHYTPQGFGTVSNEKLDILLEKYQSIENFLNYLAEGRWVEAEGSYSSQVQKQIISEKIDRQVRRTNLLEANIEDFIVSDIEQIEEGMELVGRQVDTKVVGRLDLLCKDKNGTFVVIELKRGKAGSSVMSQIQRYMGWVKEHKASGKKVRGIIIVGAKDTALEYAVKVADNIEVKVYKVSLS